MSDLTSSADRVRDHTDPGVLAEIDAETDERVAATLRLGPDAVSRRIEALEHEWDVERVLEVNASSLAGFGVLMAATGRRRWLLLSGAVTGFLLQHGIQGWCPPLAVIRRLGVRTRKEIEAERMALMAARGDFARYAQASPAS